MRRNLQFQHLFDQGVLNGPLEVSKVPSGPKMEPQTDAVTNVNAFSIFRTFYSQASVCKTSCMYHNQNKRGYFASLSRYPQPA